MSETITISATAREVKGKGASRRLRRLDDLVPGIVYGAGKAPASIQVEHRIILRACREEAFYSQVLDLNVDGKAEKVILKDLQRHPYKARIMHMDFMRIDAKKAMTAHVPLHILNEDQSPALKAGMIMSKAMVEVEVKCLPANLPESIDIDVAEFDGETVVHLSNLKLPKGVELPVLALGADHDHTVISIHKAKVAAEDEETTVEAAEVPSEHGSEDKDEAKDS